jgi:hypothetical protein
MVQTPEDGAAVNGGLWTIGYQLGSHRNKGGDARREPKGKKKAPPRKGNTFVGP